MVSAWQLGDIEDTPPWYGGCEEQGGKNGMTAMTVFTNRCFCRLVLLVVVVAVVVVVVVGFLLLVENEA